MGSKLLGRDLKFTEAKLGRDLRINPEGDLETVKGAPNLGQAIIHRLMTRKGELAELGHAQYGSRLYELVGEPNNERTRELAKMYTKECITQDPRVKDIVKISVLPAGHDRIDISISLVTIDIEVALNIVLPFYLEVA